MELNEILYPNKNNRVALELEELTDDGRLTEPSDGCRYRLREAYLLCKEVGRVLTPSEMEMFRVR